MVSSEKKRITKAITKSNMDKLKPGNQAVTIIIVKKIMHCFISHLYSIGEQSRNNL